MRGFLDCNDSFRSIKEHQRKIATSEKWKPSALDELKGQFENLTFSKADVYKLDIPHNDSLVIEPQIADCDVSRVFINTGGSVDVFKTDMLDKMELTNYIKPTV